MSKIEAATAAEYVATTAIGFRVEVRLRTKWQRLVVLYSSLCTNCR